jgi:hypothetical protein
MIFGLFNSNYSADKKAKDKQKRELNSRRNSSYDYDNSSMTVYSNFSSDCSSSSSSDCSSSCDSGSCGGD